MAKDQVVEMVLSDTLVHGQVGAECSVVLGLPSKSHCFTMSSTLPVFSLFILCSTLFPMSWHPSMLFCYSISISSTHDSGVLNRHWPGVQVASYQDILISLKVYPGQPCLLPGKILWSCGLFRLSFVSLNI